MQRIHTWLHVLLQIFILIAGIALLVRCRNSDSVSPHNHNVGKGGSMARFAILGNYLYAVDRYALNTFDISNLANPKDINKTQIGWEIETIFPYNNTLFIGSADGMYIYSLQNPVHPQLLSVYRHIRACDPVVVEGNYAYVTLRSGNTMCQGITNQLEVIDISDYTNPKQLKVFPMHNPAGLGIQGNLLFVCDGKEGLKVFDRSDPVNITQVQQFRDIDAFDVIPLPNSLLLIGKSGFFQYAYQNNSLTLLSSLLVER
ncbi:MAG: hypothetical protein NZ551_05210 [Microscillaceae bacterium]|nr:hypothetical protein [Microscillaceae bacterium]MDW8460593.1 hypothetical protein [Cytophagales bacterium]